MRSLSLFIVRSKLYVGFTEVEKVLLNNNEVLVFYEVHSIYLLLEVSYMSGSQRRRKFSWITTRYMYLMRSTQFILDKDYFIGTWFMYTHIFFIKTCFVHTLVFIVYMVIEWKIYSTIGTVLKSNRKTVEI